MTKPVILEQMLENAVAAAIGVDKPHPDVSPRIRMAASRRPRRRTGTVARADHARAA